VPADELALSYRRKTGEERRIDADSGAAARTGNYREQPRDGADLYSITPRYELPLQVAFSTNLVDGP
jgi:hypothetical protein